ncbi:MAG TPA: GNAT family N-acetyltransferase [Pyrinomonadaceae bacterium]|nr:GNAT family N-acetyltransferase [Pyrinomonadaceae bacterium]
MKVETERLLMRLHEPGDADGHLGVTGDPEFRAHFPETYRPTRDKVLFALGRFVEHWHQFGYGVWCLELKGEAGVLGYCGLRRLPQTEEVELLYGIRRAYWGRGLATEAARAALRFGFEEKGFARVMAVTTPANRPSRRVLEKCGMRYERDAVYFDMLCAYYAIERGEFRADASSRYALRD